MTLHRLILVTAFASAAGALAACGSTSGPELRAAKPMIYVSSARAASDISDCLQRRLPSTQVIRDQGSTELIVGSNAWLVTLTPSGYGSTVKVQQSASDDGGVPEPQMRFDVARCVV
ncbi:hypothetical protein [Caballeronia grimmiae]|uniref:Sugar ABC transporter ATPase n=2 Tax=Caballeronia grimmiae TaxID=1071679 RepID=A0A069PGG6_9BURK|nr:hypothetical protein [Caballeronia grimmiae]KDR36416.1 hypothetical protein BG57_16270 [Caballeronia grimmiae]